MYIRRCCARELFMSLDGGFNPSTSVFSFFFKPALLAQTDARRHALQARAYSSGN